MLKDFRHFKGNDLNRSEKVQRRVVELLLKSSIPDEKRESSIIWELKHSSGCCQIARILAQKRNMDVELARHSHYRGRELGLPCIVGAKNATKALKDGDKAEVDATAGIVRKIKK